MENYSAALRAVDAQKDLIYAAEDYLWKNPQTGYREWKANKYLTDEFEKLGYRLTQAGDIPGFFTDIDTGKPGPTLLIFGELDSLICADHPEADPETGAVHACGHCAQSAALLGLAAALKVPGALDGCVGKIRLSAVPAEELIETGYREELRKAGKIRYYGGKVEFLARGYFDDVDLCYMIHTSGGKHAFYLNKGSNGCVITNVGYKGVASHAGGSPQNGVNALYAANIGLSAINALRETFVDYDHTRVHPIITKGGDAVNAIPCDVRLESYVRGASIDAIRKVAKKVNRAIAASAAAIGANVAISQRPGYLPYTNDENLNRLAERAMKLCVPADGKVEFGDGWGTGCTDMGDICAVMPAIHPHGSGAIGAGHGNNYYIDDVDSACVESAKAQLVMAQMLLENDAAEARRIVAESKHPYKTYAEYFKLLDELTVDHEEAVAYHEDGTVTLAFN